MFFKKHMYRKIFVINRPSNKNICSEECKEFQGLHSVNSFGSLVHGLLFGRGSLSVDIIVDFIIYNSILNM